MKIRLILTGKTVAGYLQEGVSLYRERIRHYVPFEVVEIPDIKGTSSLSKEQIKAREGELILRHVSDGDDVILLDEKGSRFRSVDWARHLEHKMSHSPRDIVFVVGGSYGFSDAVYARAGSMLSLSDMTFSHQLVRLLFLEQMYRAFTIIRREPYHHE